MDHDKFRLFASQDEHRSRRWHLPDSGNAQGLKVAYGLAADVDWACRRVGALNGRGHE
jgi:hypothetical protein